MTRGEEASALTSETCSLPSAAVTLGNASSDCWSEGMEEAGELPPLAEKTACVKGRFVEQIVIKM